MTNHFSLEQLRAFADGRTNDADTNAIAVHLESCPGICMPALSQINASAPPFTVNPGQIPIRGYILLKRLGEGGFGEVWKARGPGGINVALKFIRRSADYELRALEAMKDIRHPNLVALAGIWPQGSSLILAMELCDCSLQDRLVEAVSQGHKGIPLPELLNYLRDAAAGLDALASQGIQHRDIKPGNLLIQSGGVKVADFSLAKALKSSSTIHTGLMTPAYSSPESFNGKVTLQSDQYSLAVTYFHLRTGKLLFSGTNACMLRGHLMEEPDLSSLPEPERAALARALAKEPAARWETCGALFQALAKSQKPASAKPNTLAKSEKPAQANAASPESIDYNQIIEEMNDLFKDDGESLFKKRAEQRVGVWDSAAKNGFAPAYVLLGQYHFQSASLQKDDQLSAGSELLGFQCFGLAASKGLCEGQIYLANCYAEGFGVEKDIMFALDWLHKAADQDTPRAAFAQNALGEIYEFGTDVEKDSAKAIAWYEKAAARGSADAEAGLRRLGRYGCDREELNQEQLSKVKTLRETVVRDFTSHCYAYTPVSLEEFPVVGMAAFMRYQHRQQYLEVRTIDFAEMDRKADGGARVWLPILAAINCLPLVASWALVGYLNAWWTGAIAGGTSAGLILLNCLLVVRLIDWGLIDLLCYGFGNYRHQGMRCGWIIASFVITLLGAGIGSMSLRYIGPVPGIFLVATLPGLLAIAYVIVMVCGMGWAGRTTIRIAIIYPGTHWAICVLFATMVGGVLGALAENIIAGVAATFAVNGMLCWLLWRHGCKLRRELGPLPWWETRSLARARKIYLGES